MNTLLIDKISTACIKIFNDKKEFELPQEYHYSHLPLCVIDAVFSIGVRYEAVKNTINRFCHFYNIEKHNSKTELTTTDFLNFMEQQNTEELTIKVYCNRQRTSTRNGILKSEAVIKFLKTLQNNNIEKFIDLNDSTIEKIENVIKNIPGQKSGISFKYFLMLAGNDNLVKPDRMIIRFLESVAQEKISIHECVPLIQLVVKEMNLEGFRLNPRKLDYIIWDFQRSGIPLFFK